MLDVVVVDVDGWVLVVVVDVDEVSEVVVVDIVSSVVEVVFSDVVVVSGKEAVVVESTVVFTEKNHFNFPQNFTMIAGLYIFESTNGGTNIWTD